MTVGYEFTDDRSNEYRYLLSADEMHHRVSELLKDQPPKVDNLVVCYQLEGDSMNDVARTVERIVFEKRFGNDASQMNDLYGPYEDASMFFLAVDQASAQPVGALRVIGNSDAGLMTLNTLPSEATNTPIDKIRAYHDMDSLDDCWDIGTVAVLPEYRRSGQSASVLLYRAMTLSAIQHDIKHIVSVIDEKPLETMVKYLGISFEPLHTTKPFSYEGSDVSVAVHGYVPDLIPKAKRKSITLHGLLARKALLPLAWGTKDDAITFR